MADPFDGDQTVFDGGAPDTDFTSTTLSYQPSTRTVGNVLNHVRRQFGDEAGVQIVDSDVIGWINDAQDTIVNRNRPLKATARGLDSIKGVASYKFPNNDIIQIESVLYDGQPIENVPYAEAEQSYVGGDATGTPRVWWEWSGSFTFYPTPDSSAPIVLKYTTLATKVSSTDDTLGVPDKYYQTVLNYVMQQAYELDENFNASQLKETQFNRQIDQFGEEERTAQNMLYETLTVLESDW